MNISKTTSEQNEIDNDSLVHQKENQKQKDRRGRRKKTRPSNQHIDEFNFSNQHINEYTSNCKEIPSQEDQNNHFHYRNDQNILTNEHFDQLLQRRENILAQLQKDQIQVMNPQIIPFQNRQHAIDALSAYHIFSQPSHDDLVYNFSPSYTNLFNDIQDVTESLRNTLEEHDRTVNENIVVDLLLTEEQKYIVTKYHEFVKNKKKRTKISQKQTTPRPARSLPRIRKEDRLKIKLRVSEIKQTDTIAVLRLYPPER